MSHSYEMGFSFGSKTFEIGTRLHIPFALRTNINIFLGSIKIPMELNLVLL